jgi:uncharacterized protein YndB with AHSA1/START domain
MTADTTTPSTSDRTFSMTIDIAATPGEVWRALTDASELVRWFPLQARVTPGPGGKVFWGWDDRWAWESSIETWEPPHRLRLIEHRPAFDVNGDPVAGPSRHLAMEFTIESVEGKTRLRLVHSGFGEGASWDDELESVSAGWQFELRGLAHYLENHKGRDRQHAAVNHVTSLPPDRVWHLLLSPAAFVVTSGRLENGQRVVIRTAAGHQLSGVVAWHSPLRDLFIRVDTLDDGVFRMSTWRAGGQTGVQIWMVTYNPDFQGFVSQFGAQARELVDRLFPPPRSGTR